MEIITSARDSSTVRHPQPGGELPNLIVIGAMKCATSSLHRYLDDHPDVSMSALKELNFFVGEEGGAGHPAPGARDARAHAAGRWHLGADWYRAQFDATATVRGESSPGYSSPDNPQVAGRMATIVPHARLVFMVRDPLARAVSQYRHHVREGSEARPMDVALLDPASQYISRSRYYERLQPFLEHFPRAQLLVFAQERLLRDRPRAMREIYAFAGVDPEHWSAAIEQRLNVGHQRSYESPPRALRDRFHAAVADDVERLRALTGQAFAAWGV